MILIIMIICITLLSKKINNYFKIRINYFLVKARVTQDPLNPLDMESGFNMVCINGCQLEGKACFIRIITIMMRNCLIQCLLKHLWLYS